MAQQSVAYFHEEACTQARASFLDSTHLRPQPVVRPQTGTGQVTPECPWPPESRSLLGLVEHGLRMGERYKTFRKTKEFKHCQAWSLDGTPASEATPAATAAPWASSRRRQATSGHERRESPVARQNVVMGAPAQ